jgi:hypothetical protein
MSIINRKKSEDLSQQRDESSTLNKQEVELLINMIRSNSFLGEHVETVYNMVVKLQQQYLNIKD